MLEHTEGLKRTEQFDPRNLKNGDVISLKSGGPRMTVIDDGRPPASLALSEDYRAREIKTQWFEGKTLMKGSFSRDAVKPARIPKKKLQ